ncbi:MAG TPA: hypothetical protein VE994_01365 [Terriglobales bacterium]|nr:hypothetical protein [Terriglobales bacterium]
MGSKAKYLGLSVFIAVMLLSTGVVAQDVSTGQVFLGGGPGPHIRMHFGEHFGLDEGKIVKGVPFSAQAVTEHTQTLQDGNHIHVTHNASMFRDSEGRVRREMTITGMAPLSATTNAPKFIMINDVVAGVRYILNPDTKTANKMPPKRAMDTKMFHGPDGNGNMIYRKAGPVGPEGAAQPVVESLGDQVIQGLKVQGTRTTTTIPAGQMGNERPIQIVSERWYSPDLQTTVKFVHSDPWAGETTYQLTNIIRSEPDPSLFQIPAGYAIKEGPPMVGLHGAPPPPPPDEPSH